jgi:hypothetical protein
MHRTPIRIGAALFTAAALVACGGDTTSPALTAAGTYSATRFLTTGGSGQTNQLLAGSTLNITLAGNGTTSGHLHVVPSASIPGIEADLAGTWSQNGMVVTISPTADTFVGDMPFTMVANGGANWDLVGDKTVLGTQVLITLTRLGND